jgi:hypothetical protein
VGSNPTPSANPDSGIRIPSGSRPWAVAARRATALPLSRPRCSQRQVDESALRCRVSGDRGAIVPIRDRRAAGAAAIGRRTVPNPRLDPTDPPISSPRNDGVKVQGGLIGSQLRLLSTHLHRSLRHRDRLQDVPDTFQLRCPVPSARHPSLGDGLFRLRSHSPTCRSSSSPRADSRSQRWRNRRAESRPASPRSSVLPS